MVHEVTVTDSSGDGNPTEIDYFDVSNSDNSIGDSDVDSIYIYREDGTDTSGYDTDDVQVTSGSSFGDIGGNSDDSSLETVLEGGSESYYVVVDFASSAPDAETLKTTTQVNLISGTTSTFSSGDSSSLTASSSTEVDEVPTYQSATVSDSSPNQIQVTFSEDVTETDTSDWSVDVGGSPVSSLSHADTTGNTVTFNLGQTVQVGQSITVNYGGTGDLADADQGGQTVTSFNDDETGSVTNNVDAPTFATDYPTTQNVGTSSFDVAAEMSDETADVYYVVVDDGATAPTTTEVFNGQSSGGGSLVTSGSMTGVSTSGESTETVSGLSAGTAYDVYFVAEDDGGVERTSTTAVDETADSVTDDGDSVDWIDAGLTKTVQNIKVTDDDADSTDTTLDSFTITNSGDATIEQVQSITISDSGGEVVSKSTFDSGDLSSGVTLTPSSETISDTGDSSVSETYSVEIELKSRSAVNDANTFDLSTDVQYTEDSETRTVTADDSSVETIDLNPQITGATTADKDNNGQIDQITVDFSEAVTANSPADGVSGLSFGDYSIDGDGVDSGDGTSSITFSVSEKASPDTGATPDVSYTQSGGLQDNDQQNKGVAGYGSTAASDGAAPSVVSATYRDSNTDGTVDKVDVDFSETVDFTASNTPSNDWSITPNGITNLAVESTQETSTQSGVSTVTVDVTADSGITGADGNQPTIDYSQDGAEGVDDQASSANQAVSSSPATMSDAAAPQILSSNVVGTTVEGSGDTIDITFTEDVSGADTSSNWDTFESPVGTTLTTSSAGFSYSANTLTVTLDESTDGEFLKNEDNVLVDPSSASISDGNGQDVSDSSVTSASQISGDSSPPTVSSVTTKDRDSDGKTDAAEVVFNEKIDDSTITASAWSIGGQQASSINTGTADDSTVEFRIALDGGNEVSGTEAKEVTTSSSTVNDLAGNSFTDIGSESVVETDGAAPVITGFEGESGSRRATVNFSEPVDDGSGNAITTSELSGTTLSGVSHVANTDQATVTLDAQADSAAIDSESVDESGFKDGAGNTAASNSVTLSDDRNTISLVEGWNLVSTPHVQADNTSELLDSISMSSGYSPFGYVNGQWESSAQNLALNKMDAVFVKVDTPQELELNRSDGRTQLPSRDLSEGLNLVGPSVPVESGTLKDSINNLFGGIMADPAEEGVSRVISDQRNPSGHFVQNQADGFSNNMEAFQGYWVEMETSETLFGSAY